MIGRQIVYSVSQLPEQSLFSPLVGDQTPLIHSGKFSGLAHIGSGSGGTYSSSTSILFTKVLISMSV